MNTLYHKYFLINYIELIPDITNSIRKLNAWFVVEFKLPELSDFNSNVYTNNEGFTFERKCLRTQHYHLKNKVALIYYGDKNKTFMGDNILNLDFVYQNDLYNYYIMHVKGNIYLSKCQSTFVSDNHHTMIVDPVFATW